MDEAEQEPGVVNDAFENEPLIPGDANEIVVDDLQQLNAEGAGLQVLPIRNHLPQNFEDNFIDELAQQLLEVQEANASSSSSSTLTLSNEVFLPDNLLLDLNGVAVENGVSSSLGTPADVNPENENVNLLESELNLPSSVLDPLKDETSNVLKPSYEVEESSEMSEFTASNEGRSGEETCHLSDDKDPKAENPPKPPEDSNVIAGVSSRGPRRITLNDKGFMWMTIGFCMAAVSVGCIIGISMSINETLHRPWLIVFAILTFISIGISILSFYNTCYYADL